MRKSLQLLLVVMALSVLFLLSACADESDSRGGENGEGGGAITLYSPETPDLTNELAQKYEELHDGTVNVHYAGTNVLVNQMMAEKENPQADVWYGGGGSVPFESAVDKDIINQYIAPSYRL